ncbi:nuclear transport factor 2 family protein [Chitinophagaceae bacterium MMS25-I14]
MKNVVWVDEELLNENHHMFVYFYIINPYIMIGAIIARLAVKKGFEALNRQDITAFMKSWGEEAQWMYPGNLTVSGTFTGRDKVQAWFDNFCHHFPHFTFNVRCICTDNIFALGGNNIIAAEWTLDLTNKDGVQYKNEGTTVLTIKNAKVVMGRDYLDNSGSPEFAKVWGE